jgi:hypothetical protein
VDISPSRVQPRIDRSRLAVVTATSLEAKAARSEIPGARVFESGIALAKQQDGLGDIVVSCGLAGGLRPETSSGTVLVPLRVLRPDGSTFACDVELVEAFTRAARSLGFEVSNEPIVTAAAIVRGGERAIWARRGCVGADMETGLLRAPRVAAVRVVLDTPLREISADWMHPPTALLRPRNWPEALWLAATAPRYARRAASIVAAACS